MFFNEEGQIDDEDYQNQDESDEEEEEEEEGQFLAESNKQRYQEMTMEDIASYKEMIMAHMNAAAAGGKHNKDYYEEDEEEEY